MNRSVFAPILPLKKSSEIVLKILTELSADRRASDLIANAIRNASKQPISEALLEKGLFAIHEKISDHHKLPDLIEKIYCLSVLVDKFFIHTVDVDSAQFFNRELSVLLEEELTRFGELDDPSYVPPSALELADKIFAEIEEKRLSYTKQGPSNEEILISNPSERHDTFTDKQPQMLGFPTEQVLVETDRLKARIKELESINKDLLNLPRYQTEERDDEDSHYHSIQRAGTEKKKPHLRIDNVFDFQAKSTIQRTFDLPAGTPLFNPFNFALGQKIDKVSIFSRRSKKIEKTISHSLRILSQEAGQNFGNFSDLLASEREFSASLEAQLQSKTAQLKVAEDSLAKTRNQFEAAAFDLSKLQKELDLKRVLIDGILASQARQKMEIAELSEKVLSTGKQLGLGSSLSQSLSAEKKQLLVMNENFRKRIVQLESQVQRENEAFGKKSHELKSALEKIESLEDKISFMEVQDKEKLIQIQKLSSESELNAQKSRSLLTKIDLLEDEISSQKNSKALLEEKVENLMKQRTEQKQLFDALKIKFKELSFDHETAKEELAMQRNYESELIELQKSNADLISEKRHLLAEKSRLDSEVIELQAELTSLTYSSPKLRSHFSKHKEGEEYRPIKEMREIAKNQSELEQKLQLEKKKCKEFIKNLDLAGDLKELESRLSRQSVETFSEDRNVSERRKPPLNQSKILR